ncbi:MAG: hypothetical protein LBC17_03380 [Lactobacillaceae bacterium]|jgi:transcriptional regulator of met regulon|nr:hypothetical protein [Lactobacillaceae bacterium]
MDSYLKQVISNKLNQSYFDLDLISEISKASFLAYVSKNVANNKKQQSETINFIYSIILSVQNMSQTITSLVNTSPFEIINFSYIALFLKKYYPKQEISIKFENIITNLLNSRVIKEFEWDTQSNILLNYLNQIFINKSLQNNSLVKNRLKEIPNNFLMLNAKIINELVTYELLCLNHLPKKIF